MILTEPNALVGIVLSPDAVIAWDPDTGGNPLDGGGTVQWWPTDTAVMTEPVQVFLRELQEDKAVAVQNPADAPSTHIMIAAMDPEHGVPYTNGDTLVQIGYRWRGAWQRLDPIRRYIVATCRALPGDSEFRAALIRMA